jgi:hypothetical protein
MSIVIAAHTISSDCISITAYIANVMRRVTSSANKHARLSQIYIMVQGTID